jgi:hypothetical protein
VIVSSSQEGEIMKVNLQTVGSLIVSFFNQDKVQQTARLTHFVQRASAVTGLVFLQAWVFACLEHHRVTLNQVAQACQDVG